MYILSIEKPKNAKKIRIRNKEKAVARSIRSKAKSRNTLIDDIFSF